MVYIRFSSICGFRHPLGVLEDILIDNGGLFYVLLSEKVFLYPTVLFWPLHRPEKAFSPSNGFHKATTHGKHSGSFRTISRYNGCEEEITIRNRVLLPPLWHLMFFLFFPISALSSPPLPSPPFAFSSLICPSPSFLPSVSFIDNPSLAGGIYFGHSCLGYHFW